MFTEGLYPFYADSMNASTYRSIGEMPRPLGQIEFIASLVSE